MVGAAAAYPQYYPLYPVHPVVHPISYAPPGTYFPQPQPLGRSEEFLEPLEDEKTARYLINFEAFQRVTGAFQADAAAVPALTVTGTAAFYQNPFTGNNSKYKIILNSLMAGDNYYIAFADDCAGANEVVSFSRFCKIVLFAFKIYFRN